MPLNFSDIEHTKFLQPGHQIKIIFYFIDDTAIELDAVIVDIEDSVLHLKSFGNCDTEISQAQSGTPVVILSSETWAFCRFSGILRQTSGSNITVILHGQPDIKQRRDYFRLDVQMPVIYNSPDEQQLNSLEGIWKKRRLLSECCDEPCIIKPFNDSFKILNWDNGIDVVPSMVNLSGGGLKINTSEAFKHGHLIELILFLPAPSIRALFAVASVIRSTEVSPAIANLKAYSVAMKFVFITEKDQERIISLIFNEQPG